MAAQLPLLSLLYQQTKAQFYAKGLQIATALGLPVTSWGPGDPTRSLYHFLAEILENHELNVVEYIASGFLDYAEGEDNAWLILLAKQLFNVDAIPATFATSSVTLTNGGGALYEGIEPGDITLRSSISGKTYRNTTGGTLASGPGTTLVVAVEADESGSESSAAIGEIDELVTGMLGVTCANTTAAVGLDAESATAIRLRCREKLGSLSPNGPADAYNYVAKTPELSGTTAVTRSRAVGEGDEGHVRVYLAGPSGAVSSAVVDAVEAAIIRWAKPHAVTPLVQSASNLVVPVAYTLWLYSTVGLTVAEIEDRVEEALAVMLAERPIGGDVITPAAGTLYASLVESTIRETFDDDAFRVELTTPAADVAMTPSDVAVLGTVTATIHLVPPP